MGCSEPAYSGYDGAAAKPASLQNFAVGSQCLQTGPRFIDMRGRFITFEGGEGTGKSTHSALLSDRLEERLASILSSRANRAGRPARRQSGMC